jgi:hypothetical protein
VSKEELSDDEWKIVFDPLVKKGVSNIEATIPSDTQFELLNTGSYGYESDDDDDYLPDSLRDEEIIEEVVEVPKPTFTPSENQKSLLKILNKAFNDRGWDEIELQPTRFQWIMDKSKYDGITRRRPEFRKLLASLRDANMITIEKFDGWKDGDAIYSPIEMIEEKEDERLGRIKHTDKFEEFVALNPSIFNAETFEADSKEESRLKKYEKTYGKDGAKVRNRIFKRIIAKAQDGTKAGQWSARKAQSLTEDYEKAMSGKGKKPYKSSKRTKSQKSLKKWGDQDWKTKSGKKSSKTGERYLPAKAINALTDKEYKKTSDKKRKDSKKGKQFSDQPKKIADKVAKYRAETVSYEQMDSVINEIMKKIWRNFNMKTMRDDYNNVYERFLADKAGREREGYYLKTLGITRRTTSLSFNENMFPERDEDYYTEPTSHSLKEIKDFQEVLKNDNYDIILRLEGANDWKEQITMWLTIFVKPKKTKKYRAESSKKPSSVEISRSSNSEKKLMAVFEDSEGKKMKTTHFGQRGASDYTKHGDKERMERYLERHGGGTTTSTKEDWKDPTTAGALSRWILWNKPSLKASFDDYKSRFGLKGSLNVSKSAEERKCKSCEKPATTVVQEGSFCYECLPINLGAENEAKFPFLQFTGAVLLVSLLPLFLDNRRDKV